MAAILSPQTLLTYEDYLAEDIINLRYDIVDGERLFMSSPNDTHQDIVLNLAVLLKEYGQRTGAGKVTVAPRDVLIRRLPLRTRQPNVLFITTARNALNPPRTSSAPMSSAPELVIEIVSSSDRDRILSDKLADYCAVNVLECCVVRPLTRTVEVRQLTATGSQTVATYGAGEAVVSLTFPDLRVAVDDVFAE